MRSCEANLNCYHRPCTEEGVCVRASVCMSECVCVRVSEREREIVWVWVRVCMCKYVSDGHKQTEQSVQRAPYVYVELSWSGRAACVNAY
jgi:hypothetical protein